jgi:hypothetical protein
MCSCCVHLRVSHGCDRSLLVGASAAGTAAWPVGLPEALGPACLITAVASWASRRAAVQLAMPAAAVPILDILDLVILLALSRAQCHLLG